MNSTKILKIILFAIILIIVFMAGIIVGRHNPNNTHEMIDKIMNEGLKE